MISSVSRFFIILACILGIQKPLAMEPSYNCTLEGTPGNNSSSSTDLTTLQGIGTYLITSGTGVIIATAAWDGVKKVVPIGFRWAKRGVFAVGGGIKSIAARCGYTIIKDPYADFIHTYLNNNPAEAVVGEYMTLLNAVHAKQKSNHNYSRDLTHNGERVIFEMPRAHISFQKVLYGDTDYPTKGALSGGLQAGGADSMRGYLRELLSGYGDVEGFLSSINGAYQTGALSLDTPTMKDNEGREFRRFLVYIPLTLKEKESEDIDSTDTEMGKISPKRQAFMLVKTEMRGPSGESLFDKDEKDVEPPRVPHKHRSRKKSVAVETVETDDLTDE